MNILNVDEKVLSDTLIAGAEYHSYQSITFRYDNNDEIRIPVQDNLCTLPSESYLYIEGTLLKPDGTATTSKFCKNGVLHLFSQIRYELNGVIVDTVINPGITTTIKDYHSFYPSDGIRFKNAGFV